MTKKTWWSIGILGLVVLATATIWVNRYNINDWFVLRNYQPSENIELLATGSGMNEYGQRLFYVGTPKITGGDEFNEKCRDRQEVKVLGCIINGRPNGVSLITGAEYEIYILNVTDESLDGIQEVTAAHEMLHAAYERLSPSEKSRINQELQRVFNGLKNDKLQQTVQTYAEQDTSIVLNELHSLLATEVKNIGSELERYYARYFSDRQKVVDLYLEYEAVFDEAKNQAETIYGSIQLLESEILGKRESLDRQLAELESSRAQLNILRDSGNIAAYNQQVPVYNNLVNNYNNQIAEIRDLFNRYNDLVEQYNALVVKQKQLVDAIDSNVIPEAQL